MVVVLPGVSGLVAMLAVVPVGKLRGKRLMGVLKVPVTLLFNVTAAKSVPQGTDMLLLLLSEKLPATTVKSAAFEVVFPQAEINMTRYFVPLMPSVVFETV